GATPADPAVPGGSLLPGAPDGVADPARPVRDAASPEVRPPARERPAHDGAQAAGEHTADYVSEYRPAPDYIPAQPRPAPRHGSHPDVDPHRDEPPAVSPTGEYPLPDIPEVHETANDPAAYAYTEEPGYAYAEDSGRRTPKVTVPVVQGGRQRPLGRSGAPEGGGPAYVSGRQEVLVEPEPAPAAPEPVPAPTPEPEPEPEAYGGDEPLGVPDGVAREEVYFEAYRQYIAAYGSRPSARDLSRALHESFGVTNIDGNLLSEAYLRAFLREFRERYDTEMGLSR
ncbi:hypothetical protein N566_20695, partial [Streptomycetaceae bacterium MP113-05]